MWIITSFCGYLSLVISEWTPLCDGQFFYNGHLSEYLLHLLTISWYRIIIIRYFKEIFLQNYPFHMSFCGHHLFCSGVGDSSALLAQPFLYSGIIFPLKSRGHRFNFDN